MSQHNGRYTAGKPLTLAEGWSAERLVPPSRVFGANGLRTGPDGRVYVAQVTGSTISALDVGSGELTTISAKGSDIIAPDDIAFDPRGNLYATEVMDGRVSVREATGRTRVLRDDIPCANGITFHQGRLFVGECRVGGRIMELDLNGGAPRVLVDNVPMPNAMEVGPDGLLYFPVMGTNEIWRVHPDGGAHQRVAGDLGVPDAVKFDAHGFIVSTQVHTGEVLRIDPRDGSRTRLAALEPGLDNCTFVGERLFVSNINGAITEVLANGTKPVLPNSLNWPLDLTVSEDGQLYIADGVTLYVVSGGALRAVAMLMTPGYPGFVRGLATVGGGVFMVTTSIGQVSRYKPSTSESEVLAQGLDQLYGLAVAPSGEIIVAELGTGRVLSIRSGQTEVLAS
jgi:sugar lactone lactonase YvrE